jgi:hypothetical protein
MPSLAIRNRHDYYLVTLSILDTNWMKKEHRYCLEKIAMTGLRLLVHPSQGLPFFCSSIVDEGLRP